MLRLFLFRIESTLQRTKLLRRLSPSSVARCIATDNFSLANEILSKFFSPLNISLYIDPSIRSDEVVHWINNDKGNVIFSIGSNLISANKPLFTRLFALRHLIITYHETSLLSSKPIKIHLGDNPLEKILKIGKSSDKGGIKGTFGFYYTALSGTPSQSRFNLHHLIHNKILNGSKILGVRIAEYNALGKALIISLSIFIPIESI